MWTLGDTLFKLFLPGPTPPTRHKFFDRSNV